MPSDLRMAARYTYLTGLGLLLPPDNIEIFFT